MELKELYDEMQRTWGELKETINLHGNDSSEQKERIEKINDRLDELETKLSRPPVSKEEKQKEEADAETKVFVQWARKGQVGPEAEKLLATDDQTAGGFVVPTVLRNRITEMIVDLSNFRSFASVETISGNQLDVPKETGTFDSGWVSERESRPATGNIGFGMDKISVEEMYAMPKATQRALDDMFFDVESWIARKLAERFVATEDEAFVIGNGKGRPQGLTSAKNIEEIKSGSATVLDANKMIDVVYKLPEQFESRARWYLRRATVAHIRQMQINTTDKTWIWQPGLQSGEPFTILGYPFTTMPHIPAMADGAYPVWFGDMAAAYQIVDRPGISMIRDNVTEKGYVLFYATRRVGGQVIQPKALVKNKQST